MLGNDVMFYNIEQRASKLKIKVSFYNKRTVVLKKKVDLYNFPYPG